MAWITDSLRSAIAAVTSGYGRNAAITTLPGVVNFQLAYAAYQSSGMLQKVMHIPAADRVREWRDWQADKDAIAAIEAEERRLGLQRKVQQAEVLRGIGGGALILAAPGDPAQPIGTLGKRGLAAVNAVSRWQLSLVDVDTNMASPTYGEPRMFRVESGGRSVDIHPSRVICFRGDPLPAGAGIGDDERFWGSSRLMRVLREVENSDSAQRWYAELVRKAKLLRIGISGLTDYTATAEGRQQLNSRVALIAEGENALNATVYNLPTKDGAGNSSGGESIDDFQMTWAGIPAMADMFDQRVAAVADIPFTRLMGRSPAGMNATGAYDDQNWAKAVASGQQLETRPCMEQMDDALIRSAGVSPEGVTWKWAPLWAPTEKEEADTFKTLMEAVEKVQNTAAIPDVAFSEAFQNLMEEREYIPGLGAALAKLPEGERFGVQGEPDDADPSAIQEGSEPQSREAGGAVPRRRAANDAKPRTLYVSRKVQNVGDLAAWAKAQGLPALDDDLHVTIAYSTTPVDWIAMGSTWAGDDKGAITIAPGGPRVIEPLGNRTAVLMFASSNLSWRNREMREAGASWDFPDYQPHISLTGDPVELAAVDPYRGRIVLGPEVFEEIKREVADESVRPFEDGYNPAQARDPRGRWASGFAWVGLVLNSKVNHKGVAIGRAGSAQAAKLAKLGHDVDGKKLALDSSQVRHIDKRHGKGEWRKGQRAVTAADIAAASSVFSASVFGLGSTHADRRFVGVAKINGERIETVWENRRHAVILFDMWIKP